MSCDIPCLHARTRPLKKRAGRSAYGALAPGCRLKYLGRTSCGPSGFAGNSRRTAPRFRDQLRNRKARDRAGRASSHLPKGGLNVHEITRRTRKLHVKFCHAPDSLYRKTLDLPLLAAGAAAGHRRGRGTPAQGRG